MEKKKKLCLQANPVFIEKPDVAKENMHQRFEEQEEEQMEQEDMSASAMRSLYSQSVAVSSPSRPPFPAPKAATESPMARVSNGSSAKVSNGSSAKASGGPQAVSTNGSSTSTNNSSSNGSHSTCEDALLASLDQRVVSNRCRLHSVYRLQSKLNTVQCIV